MKEKKYTTKELRDFLPVFIEDEYPKERKDGKRGCATVAIALFTLWLEKQELIESQE